MQAWLFWKLHTVAPGAGYEFGMFMTRKNKNPNGVIEVHMRAPGSRGPDGGGGSVYKVVKHRSAPLPEERQGLARDYV